MKEAWKTGHINRWLASNCFGDYYTRKGLDLKQREMITFCFLVRPGRMRTSAYRSRQGKYESRKRQRIPDKSRFPVSSYIATPEA